MVDVFAYIDDSIRLLELISVLFGVFAESPLALDTAVGGSDQGRHIAVSDQPSHSFSANRGGPEILCWDNL